MKYAIITGAAGTLGRAVCNELIREELEIIAIMRPGGARYSGPGLTVECNLENLEETHSLFQSLNQSLAHKQVDELYLVHAAGIYEKTQLGADDYARRSGRMMTLHTHALAAMVNALIPLFSTTKSGGIIGVGTNLLARTNHDSGGYLASKHALWGLIRQLAVDLGPYSFNSNLVSPGLFRSGINQNTLTTETIQKVVKNSAIPRELQAEEIAKIISALCHPRLLCVTGQHIICDYGNSLRF